MTHLLERLGVELSFPPEQTCCGQPHFNNGFESQAREVARNFILAFSKSDAPIVGPSGSCVSMVKHHYPELFPAGTTEHATAVEIASRTYEFTEYLVNVLKVIDVGASYPHKVTYHASCHYLREMGLKTEAKALLNAVKGLEFIPLNEEETCCGGFAYGWFISGPIGAIFAPQMLGTPAARELPYASMLCGACANVCPVKIPIPAILRHLRRRVAQGDDFAAPTMPAPIRRLPTLSRWTKARPLPPFTANFRAWWHNRE
jgi:Fe-S oxidoreductase